jgi:hypothetical protein
MPGMMGGMNMNMGMGNMGGMPNPMMQPPNPGMFMTGMNINGMGIGP